MGEVTVYDAVRMKDIEDGTIVNGEINPSTGHLMLTRHDGTEIDAGLVVTSPKVVTSATRPTGGALFEGLEIYETDTNKRYVYDGAAWIQLTNMIICTSATRPATNLYEGLRIYETDTDRTLAYDGANWRVHGGFASMLHEQGSCTTIGTNDYAGASFANVDLNRAMAIPAGARNIHITLNLMFRTLASLQTWDLQLKFNGSLVANSARSIACPDSSVTGLTWTFVVACAGLTNPALQIEAARLSGSGGHRQSASYYALQWFFD